MKRKLLLLLIVSLLLSVVIGCQQAADKPAEAPKDDVKEENKDEPAEKPSGPTEYLSIATGGTGGTGNRVDIVNGNYKKDSNGNYVFSTSGKIKIEDTYEEGTYYKIYYSNATSEFAQAPTLSDRLLYPKTDSTKVYYEGTFKEWDSAVLSSSRVYKMDKSKLLNSEATPADYLLSYLKKFNLRIWTDIFNKTVHIAPRNKYYIDEVKDINDLVDRAGDSTITPLSVTTKYMRFSEPIESTKLSKEYKEDYGIEYGEQKIDTGYEFDSSTTDLFDTSIFNTAWIFLNFK